MRLVLACLRHTSTYDSALPLRGTVLHVCFFLDLAPPILNLQPMLQGERCIKNTWLIDDFSDDILVHAIINDPISCSWNVLYSPKNLLSQPFVFCKYFRRVRNFPPLWV